jgi:hypothetical protein
VKLHLKFKTDADDEAIRQVIRKAEAAGADAVRPLFPGTKQVLLSRIYSIDVSSPADAKKLMSLLRTLDSVEHIEGEVKRSLR